MKNLRVTGLILYCLGPHCSNSKKVSFEELDMPDNTVAIEAANSKPFVCSKCGSREFDVRPDWPDPMEEMARRNREEER